MKKYIKYALSLSLAAALFACDKEELAIYNQDAGVNFQVSSSSYSFIDAEGALEKTINIGVNITGDSTNYDREFEIEIITDSITNAPASSYSIGKGVVKAGEFTGMLPITVKYDKTMDTEMYDLHIKIVPSKDFPQSTLNARLLTFTYTNLIIQPENWRWLRWYFGTPYSTGWWKFIMDTTGRTSLPYYPTHSDKVTWWMDVNELKAYQTQVRVALERHNSQNPGNPLTHDDGDYKGTPVEMP